MWTDDVFNWERQCSIECLGDLQPSAFLLSQMYSTSHKLYFPSTWAKKSLQALTAELPRGPHSKASCPAVSGIQWSGCTALRVSKAILQTIPKRTFVFYLEKVVVSAEAAIAEMWHKRQSPMQIHVMSHNMRSTFHPGAGKMIGTRRFMLGRSLCDAGTSNLT